MPDRLQLRCSPLAGWYVYSGKPSQAEGPGPIEYVTADAYRKAIGVIESIRDTLQPFVEGGEPAAEDAVDIYEMAVDGLDKLRALDA